MWRLLGWKRLAISGLCLVAWRALEQIPVAGLNPGLVNQLLQQTDTTNLIHAIGGGFPLARYSIVALGIGPYINAWMLMSLAPIFSVRLREMRDSPDGRQSLQLWTRALTVVLAAFQAYSWTVLMQSPTTPPQLDAMDWFTRLAIVLQLTGGTMVMVLLADTLNEFGFGFGHGAILLYALNPLPVEVQRLAHLFASTPSVQAIYLPFAIWVLCSIAVVMATVAVFRAARRVAVIPGEKLTGPKQVDLTLVMSGVLRPPEFAGDALFMPVAVANIYSNPGLLRWTYDVMTPYGPNPWTDLAFLVVDASLLIAFAYFVVAVDYVGTTIPRSLVPHMFRVTFIGGSFLVVTVVLMPVVAHIATQATGMLIPFSGFQAVLVTTAILRIVVSPYGVGTKDDGVPVLTSRLP